MEETSGNGQKQHILFHSSEAQVLLYIARQSKTARKNMWSLQCWNQRTASHENTLDWWKAVIKWSGEQTNTFSCQPNNVLLRSRCYFNDLRRGQIMCKQKKKKKVAVKTVPKRAYQQHLICFPLTHWKRNHKSMCLLEQIELGGCVLNGRAPGVLNNDSQSPLCLLGVGVRCRRSLNGKIFCPNNGLLLSPPCALSVCHQPSTLFLNNWH